MINKNSKNKNNGLVYLISELTKIKQQHQYIKEDKELNKQQQHQIKKTGLRNKQATTNRSVIKADKQMNRKYCTELVHIYGDFAETMAFYSKCDIKGKTVKQLLFRRNSISLV